MKVSVQNKLKSWGIDRKSLLLIGVSGGPDSLSLLHLLFTSGFNVLVVNVDHNLRDESRVESKYVEEFCRERDIKFYGVSVDTLAMVKENGISIEEAARKLRYSELFKIANEVKADAVCVAHNADDQVETVLMHLIRGTGLTGLTGMKDYSIIPEWDSEIPVIRPLITESRKDIEEYCDLNGLNPVQDESNQDNKFMRNRIRNKLIPLLEDYNPNIRNSLFQMSEILSADLNMIKDIVDDAWVNSVYSFSKECVILNRVELSEYSIAIQRHLFRNAIYYLKSGLRDVSFNTINIITNSLAEKASGSDIDLANNLLLTFDKEKINLHNFDFFFNIEESLQLFKPEINLEFNQKIQISPKWNIYLEVIDFNEELFDNIKNNEDEYSAYVDANKISNLTLSINKKGDRFSPLGMKGKSIKISDYFINQKVPRRERENWPILYSDKRIVWVTGFQISDEFKLNKQSKKVLKFRVFKD